MEEGGEINHELLFYCNSSNIYNLYICNNKEKRIYCWRKYILGIWCNIYFNTCNISKANSSLLHIAYPPSLLFLIAIIFLLFVNFRETKKIEKQKEKIMELAQRLSILEYEVDNLKKEKNTDDKNKK